jgi:hypothetical protein
MSTVYRPAKSISIGEIKRDRLSKYGIQVRRETGSMYLIGPGGSVLAVKERDGSVYLENPMTRPPLLVIKALMAEFDTEIFDESGGRCWGPGSWEHTAWGFDSPVKDGNDVQETLVLVEGPEDCDAGFVASWLQAAVNADEIAQTYEVNPKSGTVLTLADVYDIQFGAMAARYAGKFLTKRGVFAVDVSELPFPQVFATMVKLRFFTLTGNRYQMTMPDAHDGSLIAEALARAFHDRSATELGADNTIQTHTRKAAITLGKQLRAMGDVERLERRAVLLMPHRDLDETAPKRKRNRR